MPFHVTEDAEFRIGKRLIARYLVGNTYRLTTKNQEFVADLIEQGKAAYGQIAAEEASIALRASGRITVKP
jgi:hypothetical protein